MWYATYVQNNMKVTEYNTINNKEMTMDLHVIQDLLNNLNTKFKIFACPNDNTLILRIYHNNSNKVDNYTEITYNTRGDYVSEPIL